MCTLRIFIKSGLCRKIALVFIRKRYVINYRKIDEIFNYSFDTLYLK